MYQSLYPTVLAAQRGALNMCGCMQHSGEEGEIDVPFIIPIESKSDSGLKVVRPSARLIVLNP